MLVRLPVRMQIERDMKADILEFTNKAANVLTQSAVGYFQDCMGMDNEVSHSCRSCAVVGARRAMTRAEDVCSY